MTRLGLLAAAALPAFLLSSIAAAAPAPSGTSLPQRQVPASASAPAPPSTVPGEVLVRYRSNAGGSERAQARRSARVALKRDMRLRDAQVLRAEPGQSVEDAIAALERHGSVRYAEPNRVFRASATTPNDTHFLSGSLWGLHNTGQTVDAVMGVADADMDAPEAWDLFKQAPGVKVAVVDSGVRWDHPDLDGNVFANVADPPGGGDNDANGLVDDVRGWDFVDNDNNPTDLNDHGTHVAGTIAAEGNNAAGVTGVAWDAQIIPVRVLDAAGYGSGDAILDGFDYAGDMGARVVNASLGGEGNGQMYADVLAEHPDTLFVVAAGNDGSDNDAVAQEPCNAPAQNLICVAATDNRDQLAGFSNYGAGSVDLAAPGVDTLSTVPEFADVLTDDFEVSLSKWTTVGSSGGTWSRYVYNGSIAAGDDPDAGFTFSNSENIFLRSAQPVNLTGRSQCVLEYDLRYGYSFQNDGLLVETSPNGTNWTVRDTYTGENGVMEEMKTDLRSDGVSSLLVRFRVIADTTGETENGQPKQWFGSMLDDVRVKCAASTDANNYGAMSGTSMASPHVAGVATLLFGARPDAGVAQVRNWLLLTGDQLAPLNGKTVTGRRLNAHSALLAATGQVAGPEVITDAPDPITATTATLRGRIDPNGTPTTYKFLYGTSPGALTSQVPATPGSVGSGTELVPVSAPIAVTAGSTYYYKLVAIQGTTETSGIVESFTPAVKRPPTLTVEPASGVGQTTATLAGTVNPNGKQTTVLLEFGTVSGTYASQTNSLDVGAGTEPEELVVELTSLRPGTQYFYRLRASNADGESVSPERSFTTLPGVAPPPVVSVTPIPTPVSPPPNGTPPQPNVSIACKLSRAKRIGCTARSSTAGKVSIRITRAGRLYARGTAPSLKKGRALKVKTLRRARRGRYKLQITFIRGGVTTTLTRTIKL